MLLEDLLKALALCASDGNKCRECPLFNVKACGNMLKNWALYYLKQATEKTRLEVRAPLNPSPDLIGEIMNHYKKPFVTIEINISEDES